MALKRHQQAIASPDMSYVKQPSRELARLVLRQDGLVTVEQLEQHGFDPSAIYRRVKSSKWQRLLPTVILTTSGQPTRRQLLIAAVLWAGEGAAVDGADACAWYGLTPPGFDPRHVHVVVPDEAPVRSRAFVTVRRSCADIRIGARTRVPYVEAPSALIVAARHARTVAAAIGILSRGLQTQLVDVAALVEARESIGDKFCRGVDQALLAVGVGLRSPAEKTNHDLILTSRVLPEPLWNQWLDLGDAGVEICADALWENAGMFEEVLGRRWHAWAEQFENTEERRGRAVAAGLVAQGVTPTQLNRSPRAVLRRLETTYLANAGRGMPTGVRLIDPPAWLTRAIAC